MSRRERSAQSEARLEEEEEEEKKERRTREQTR